MTDGWEESAAAWIGAQGSTGDFGRQYVLDPVMLPRAITPRPKRMLDVGCGEGRFCRILAANGVEATGLDPTEALISEARRLDPRSTYVSGTAEALPFQDASFDLVVSYLSLIDIPDIERAIPEMTRVLEPGGRLLVANLTSFNTAGNELDWTLDASGRRLSWPVDRYMTPRASWVSWRGIRVINHHRPLSTYMKLFLHQGLVLSHFDEPLPTDDAPVQRASDYIRAPWFLVMEWVRPHG